MLSILGIDELVEPKDVLELVSRAIVVVSEEGGVEVRRVGTLLGLYQGLARQQSLERVDAAAGIELALQFEVGLIA